MCDPNPAKIFERHEVLKCVSRYDVPKAKLLKLGTSTGAIYRAIVAGYIAGTRFSDLNKQKYTKGVIPEKAQAKVLHTRNRGCCRPRLQKLKWRTSPIVD